MVLSLCVCRAAFDMIVCGVECGVQGEEKEKREERGERETLAHHYSVTHSLVQLESW